MPYYVSRLSQCTLYGNTFEPHSATAVNPKCSAPTIDQGEYIGHSPIIHIEKLIEKDGRFFSAWPYFILAYYKQLIFLSVFKKRYLGFFYILFLASPTLVFGTWITPFPPLIWPLGSEELPASYCLQQKYGYQSVMWECQQPKGE